MKAQYQAMLLVMWSLGTAMGADAFSPNPAICKNSQDMYEKSCSQTTGASPSWCEQLLIQMQSYCEPQLPAAKTAANADQPVSQACEYALHEELAACGHTRIPPDVSCSEAQSEVKKSCGQKVFNQTNDKTMNLNTNMLSDKGIDLLTDQIKNSVSNWTDSIPKTEWTPAGNDCEAPRVCGFCHCDDMPNPDNTPDWPDDGY